MFVLAWQPRGNSPDGLTKNSENDLGLWMLTDSSVINDTEFGPFSSSPLPSTWGEENRYGGFNTTHCPLQNLQLILNITLCGGPFDGTDCTDKVKQAGALDEAYWEIGRMSVQSNHAVGG